MASVVFLRGVNVGGHRRFSPSTLAAEMSHLGVINIGAAGTFIVRRPISRARLRQEFAKRLPFSAEFMVCSGRELIAASAEHPYDELLRNVSGQPSARASKRAPPAATADLVRFVSVLAKKPRVLPKMPLRIPAEGRWLVTLLGCRGKFVFGIYRREMKAIGFLGKIDTLLGAPVTTRNWNTIHVIRKKLSDSRP